MSTLFQSDQLRRPDLFQWNGPLSLETVSAWIAQRGLKLPKDLVALWIGTGGGDMFESETVLSPLAGLGSGMDVEEVNEIHRCRGLPLDYLVVHTGTALTAIRQSTGTWVLLDADSYRILEEYASFEEWFAEVIHREFADRYGLAT